MTRFVLPVLALALALALPTRAAEATPKPLDARVAHITALLDAVRKSDRDSLANTVKYIQIVERNKCQAPEQSLRVGCVVEAAAQSCRQSAPGGAAAALRERCILVSDVVATNQLAEAVFLPKDVRYAIMNKYTDYRTAIAAELSRRHALLVTDFVSSAHFPGVGADTGALARGIDGYCREVAGKERLSWQYCVAAAVWFIGTDGGITESRR